MFDELAEAVYREKITQLETLVQQKNDRIAELRQEIEKLVASVQDEKDSLAGIMKDRESELAYFSKELTEREREVEQLKHLSQHLEQRLAAEREVFEQQKIQTHFEYENRLKDQQDQIAELQEHVGKLEETIHGLRERERELSESRETLAVEYETQYQSLQARLEEYEGLKVSAAENERLLELAKQELERFLRRTRDLESREARHSDEIRELNRSQASAQEEIARLNSELQTVQGVARQQRVELEAEVEAERRKRQEAADEADALRVLLDAEEGKRQAIERDYTERLGAFESQFEALKAQLRVAEASGEHAETFRTGLEAEQNAQESIETQYRQQVSELQGIVESLRLQLAEAEADRSRHAEASSGAVPVATADGQGVARDALFSSLESQFQMLRDKLAALAATNEQAELLQNDIKAIQQRISDAEQAHRGQVEVLAGLREAVRSKEADIQTLRQLLSQLEETEFQIAVLKERLGEKDKDAAELSRTVDIAKTEIELLRTRLNETEETRDASVKRVQVLQKESEDLSRVHQEWMELMTADIAEMEEERQRHSEEMARMKARVEELEAAQAELSAAQAKVSDLEKSLSQEERAIQELVDRNLQTQRELSDRHIAMESARSQIHELQASLREAEKANQDLQARATMMEQDLRRAKGELVSTEARMKEMKESYERRLEAAMSTMDGGDLERFAALQDELNRNAGRLAATEVEISSLREQASGLEDALVVARSAMDSLQKEKVEIERVLSDERALVEELSRRDAMNREELLNLTARLNDAQPSVEQVTAHATDAETEAPAVAESELAVVDMQTRHDGLLARIGELETERETLRDTIAAHVSEIEGLRGKVIPALEQERDRLVTEREELVQKLAATSEERDQYRKEAEMALEQADVLQNAVAEANGKAENLQADKQQLESVLNDERALVEQLTQRRREDEGALEGLKTQVADADRIHQEALAKLQDAVDEQHAALEAKEGEVIGALEARRSLEEELRQAHELNEALESLIESQKSELAQVAKVELPAALETRDKFRQELDGARKECDALREERGTLQAQVDRLEVALEASGGTVREFEERLGMSDRTLREVSHELKIETDERRRLDQWKMRSMMAHAAAVLLAVGLLIYAVGGRTRVSDHGVRVDSAGTTEGVAGADGQPANSTTPTDTAPSITPGQSIPEFQGPPGATPTQAIEEEARTFAVNANPQSGSGTSGAKTAAAGATSETKQGEPKRYTLKKGDSLWLVAKREYGDPQRWKDIAKANNLDSRESRLLRPGYELILP